MLWALILMLNGTTGEELIPIEKLTYDELSEIKDTCFEREEERIKQVLEERYSDTGTIEYLSASFNHGDVTVKKAGHGGGFFFLEVDKSSLGLYENFYEIEKVCEGIEGATSTIGPLGETIYSEEFCFLRPKVKGQVKLMHRYHNKVNQVTEDLNLFIDYDSINQCIFQKVDFSKSLALIDRSNFDGVSMVEGIKPEKESSFLDDVSETKTLGE